MLLMKRMKLNKGIYIFLVGLVYLFSGCGQSFREQPVTGEDKSEQEKKIVAEAYLFDAKLKREGKVNSFRLEIFQTDSALGLGGRAYLGKGALKGRLTEDSVVLYFPARNQYVQEAVDDFFKTLDCPMALSGSDLLKLFMKLPDSFEFKEGVEVLTDYSDNDHPDFILSTSHCPWRIELTYDRQKMGWRLEDFIFSDGDDLTIEARRREYKSEAKINLNKFQVHIHSSSYKIEP
jgi:hypothetical protein